MKKLIIAAAILVAGPAFAESDNANSNGTFAGQTTRGAVVQGNHDQYGVSKDGQFDNKVVEQAQAGTRDDAIADLIGRDSVVGYGRNK